MNSDIQLYFVKLTSSITKPHKHMVYGGSGGQMALRWPLEAQFELFWALVAKWLSDGLCRVILSYSWLWWPNCSQMVSGRQFLCLLGSGGQMALRWRLEGHFPAQLARSVAPVHRIEPPGTLRHFPGFPGNGYLTALPNPLSTRAGG